MGGQDEEREDEIHGSPEDDDVKFVGEREKLQLDGGRGSSVVSSEGHS